MLQRRQFQTGLFIEQAVIQLLGRRPQRAVEGAKVRDPAMAVQRFAPHSGLDREGMAVHPAIGTAVRLVGEMVGRVEGGRLGDLENAHLTPMYLWVWTLSRHFGWVRQ